MKRIIQVKVFAGGKSLENLTLCSNFQGNKFRLKMYKEFVFYNIIFPFFKATNTIPVEGKGTKRKNFFRAYSSYFQILGRVYCKIL